MGISFWISFVIASSLHELAYGNNNNCGIATVQDNRIVYGHEARRGSQPWLVSLETLSSSSVKWNHLCGGAIIDKRWILTAAHCFRTESRIENWRVIGGEHDKKVHESSEQIIEPEKIIKHEDFVDMSLYESAHDIALIKLATPIRTNTAWSRKICLADREHTFEADTPCVVAGWGETHGTSQTKNSTYKLQMYNSTIVSLPECNSTAQEYESRVTNNMICIRTEFDYANDRSSGGVCGGDSGGPLMCKVGDHYYLAGLTSWSIRYSCGYTHDVFTRVQKYRDWIDAKMKTE